MWEVALSGCAKLTSLHVGSRPLRMCEVGLSVCAKLASLGCGKLASPDVGSGNLVLYPKGIRDVMVWARKALLQYLPEELVIKFVDTVVHVMW